MIRLHGKPERRHISKLCGSAPNRCRPMSICWKVSWRSVCVKIYPPLSDFDRNMEADAKEDWDLMWMSTVPTKSSAKTHSAYAASRGKTGSLTFTKMLTSKMDEHPHGIPTLFRFSNKPSIEVSQITEVVENPNASYVLQVEGVDITESHPNID